LETPVTGDPADPESGLHPAMDVVAVTRAVGDQTRADILKTLAHDAFGVLELADIFDMAQPALSHHLKKLSEAGLLNKRREGTSVFYQRVSTRNAPLLEAIYQALDAEPLPSSCRDGMHRVYAARARQSRDFFNHQADALAKQTALICAPEVYADTVLKAALAEPALQRERALEVGPGSGVLLHALATQFREVTGVDNSAEMLAKTQDAVADLDNVHLVDADFAQLGRTPRFNLVAAAMVLHHMPSPLAFFQHAAQLLDPHGVLVIAELCRHEQDWVKSLCGDLWLGFEPRQLAAWAAQAGLQQTQQQFLAQRNGFRVQVNTFISSTPSTFTNATKENQND